MPSSVTYLVGNPISHSNFTPQHVLGHLVWGLAVGLVSFRLKYFVIAGLFPFILDADHILSIFDIEILPRMAHSLLFGVFAATIMAAIMIAVYRRIDILLIMISASAVFSHISFDIFQADSAGFPLFTPLSNNAFFFNHHDWIVFQIIAISFVAIGTLLAQRQKINNTILSKDG